MSYLQLQAGKSVTQHWQRAGYFPPFPSVQVPDPNTPILLQRNSDENFG